MQGRVLYNLDMLFITVFITKDLIFILAMVERSLTYTFCNVG